MHRARFQAEATFSHALGFLGRALGLWVQAVQHDIDCRVACGRRPKVPVRAFCVCAVRAGSDRRRKGAGMSGAPSAWPVTDAHKPTTAQIRAAWPEPTPLRRRLLCGNECLSQRGGGPAPPWRQRGRRRAPHPRRGDRAILARAGRTARASLQCDKGITKASLLPAGCCNVNVRGHSDATLTGYFQGAGQTDAERHFRLPGQ